MASEPLIPISPDWPACTLAEAKAELTAPGAKFEMDEVEIRGMPTRVWKNAPPTLRVLAEAVRAYGAREFTVYEDERVTYEANFRAVCHLAAKMREMGVAPGDQAVLL